MKHLLLLLMACTGFAAVAQDPQVYLREAQACFDKGDYECAKRGYLSYGAIAGNNATDVSGKIRDAEECYKTTIRADGDYDDRDYTKAAEQYKKVLDKNPKDPHAKARYDDCMKDSLSQISPVIKEILSDMVYVEGGTYIMGCTDERDGHCFKYEKPAHQVAVENFRMGKYEVTQCQWKAVMESDPSSWSAIIPHKVRKGDDLPVVYVSWNEVQEFITELNRITSKQFRLPTEAEWEFAARGGNKSKNYKYAGSNNINDVAWYYNNNTGGIHPVGQKQPNELGLYDMSGNVWEWCSDWYGENYYSQSTQYNPGGPESGSERVIRGAGCENRDWSCRSANRFKYTPTTIWMTGFRLVLQ